MTYNGEIDEEPKDRTPWIWVGIAAVIAVMIGLLFMYSGSGDDVSVVRIRHILVNFRPGDPVDQDSALQLARDLKSRIESGESFAKLAKEYSADEHSAPRGGDLGYRRMGEFEGVVEEWVWTGDVGSVSEILESPNAYHLIRIEDRKISEIDRLEMERKERVQSQ